MTTDRKKGRKWLSALLCTALLFTAASALPAWTVNADSGSFEPAKMKDPKLAEILIPYDLDGNGWIEEEAEKTHLPRHQRQGDHRHLRLVEPRKSENPDLQQQPDHVD